jgi:putative aminopeptidase FrvX
MQSYSHNGTAYTVQKVDGMFQAAYRDAWGNVVVVKNKLKRVAVASIKAHIDDA